MNSKIVVIGLSGESVFFKVDHFHREGETINADNLVVEPGGKGYNQAVACKKLGACVDYLTVVGDDYYGSHVIEYLENLDIKVHYDRLKDKKTAFASILTNSQGSNQVTVFGGASNYLTIKHVDLIEDAIKEADFLLVQLEISYDVVKKAIDIAKKYNTKIVLNPAPAKIKYFDSILEQVDYLTPNEIEARDIFDIPKDIKIEDYGKYLQSIVRNDVIITLGAKGCLWVSAGKYQYFEPKKVKSVDTTGAGDVFNAALAVKLKNNDIVEAIEFAIRASALSVTKPYVMNAIPTIKEVEEFK